MAFTTSSCLHDQHDDHCWLTVGGEAWAIRAMHWPVIWLWRGYWPNHEYSIVRMEDFNAESYCDKAVALLYG
jgi:hypothetical protein